MRAPTFENWASGAGPMPLDAYFKCPIGFRLHHWQDWLAEAHSGAGRQGHYGHDVLVIREVPRAPRVDLISLMLGKELVEHQRNWRRNDCVNWLRSLAAKGDPDGVLFAEFWQQSKQELEYALLQHVSWTPARLRLLVRAIALKNAIQHEMELRWLNQPTVSERGRKALVTASFFWWRTHTTKEKKTIADVLDYDTLRKARALVDRRLRQDNSVLSATHDKGLKRRWRRETMTTKPGEQL